MYYNINNLECVNYVRTAIKAYIWRFIGFTSSNIIYKFLLLVCLLVIIVSICVSYHSHINYINYTLQDWFNLLITGGPGPGGNLTGGGPSGGGPSGGGPPGGGPSGGEALAGHQSHEQQRDNTNWWMNKLYYESSNTALFLDNSSPVPDQAAEAINKDFVDKDIEELELKQMVRENNRRYTQLHQMRLNREANSERYRRVRDEVIHSRDIRENLIKRSQKRTKFFDELFKKDTKKKNNYGK